MRKGVMVAMLAGLAACSGAGEQPSKAPDNGADEPGENYVATVAALPEGQRNGVLFRAIRDSGNDCQSVTGARRIDDQPGVSGWAVVCDGRSAWAVALKPDGTAVVAKAQK